MDLAKQHKTKDELSECPNSKGYHLANQQTGEIHVLGCNRYDCDYCGKRKKAKLQIAIERVVATFDHVRMFTFNFDTNVFFNQEHAIMKKSEVWRRFLNNIRRDKALSKRKKAFQYIKTTEFTKRGYPHFHVISDEFIPVDILVKHWRNAIYRVTGIGGRNGSVHTKGQGDAKHGARYITKYITKMSKDFDDLEVSEFYEDDRRKFRLYSRSRNLRLFHDKCSIYSYEFIKVLDVEMRTTTAGGGFTSLSYPQLPQNQGCFELNLPPPWQKLWNQPEEYLKQLKLASEFHNNQFNNYGMTV